MLSSPLLADLIREVTREIGRVLVKGSDFKQNKIIENENLNLFLANIVVFFAHPTKPNYGLVQMHRLCE